MDAASNVGGGDMVERSVSQAAVTFSHNLVNLKIHN